LFGVFVGVEEVEGCGGRPVVAVGFEQGAGEFLEDEASLDEEVRGEAEGVFGDEFGGFLVAGEGGGEFEGFAIAEEGEADGVACGFSAADHVAPKEAAEITTRKTPRRRTTFP
jgi:hypothetical protein